MIKKWIIILWVFLIISVTLSISSGFISNYGIIQDGKVPPFVYIPVSFDKEDSFSVEVSPLVALTNINYKVPHSWWEVLDASTPLYLYEELSPFITLKLSYQNDFSKLHIEFLFRRSHTAFFTWPNTTVNFLPTYPYISMDINFPRNSYLFFNFKDYFLMIGRTKLKWGYWDYPMSISDYAPYFDNITYVFKSGNWFSYTYHIIWIDPILTSEEYKIQSTTVPVNHDPLSPYFDRSKVMVAHRMDFLLSPNFEFSIGELNMIGGKYPDLFTISPVNVWHNNYTESFTNSIGTFQAAWTPIKGLNFYFDFAVDDYAIPLTEPSDVKPTAYGLSTGVIKTFSTKLANFMLTLNYSETTKWMYNTFLPYLKYDTRIRFISNFPVSARTIVSFPIGFRYGSDSSLISFNIKFFNRYINGSMGFIKLEKGRATILTKYKADIPEDPITYYGINFSLESSYGIALKGILLNDFYYMGMVYRLKF